MGWKKPHGIIEDTANAPVSVSGWVFIGAYCNIQKKHKPTRTNYESMLQTKNYNESNFLRHFPFSSNHSMLLSPVSSALQSFSRPLHPFKFNLCFEVYQNSTSFKKASPMTLNPGSA